jgi:hypothetical protein
LEEARALVEQSSNMVEQAGAVTARKLDDGAAAARATLRELEGMLADLEERTRAMPAAARAQAEQVRATVTQGMEELTQHARRTAAEAQAMDAAFQERVRRNFDMLSEAVRLMGAVAAAAPAAPVVAPPAPAPASPEPPSASIPTRGPSPLLAHSRPTFQASYRAPTLHPPTPVEPAAPEVPTQSAAVEPPTAQEPEAAELELDDLVEAAPADTATQPASKGLAERLGLRPRLKLTPTASDEEFSSIFEAAGGPPPAQATGPTSDEEAEDEEPNDQWTWKDLLQSLEGGDGAEGEEGLESGLSTELAKMGVEPDKLLPKARIDEIAAAVQTGDLDGARQVVKRLAPAGTRRIVRRLFTDSELRDQVDDFVRRYQAVVDDAAVQDPEGFLMAKLLGSAAGKLYLILDTARGDVA